MVRIVRGHGGPIFAVAFYTDGKQIFSIGREGIGRIIDTDSDKILYEWKAYEDWAYALAIGLKGRLATGDWSGEVKIWMVKDGEVTRQKP
jgi:WD40 repeat protein